MRNLPPVSKNILIITFLCWLASLSLQRYGVDLNHWFGLHYVLAKDFYIWQPITYMLMHANFTHLFCNMFAVLMFAPAIEDRWGGRRFLIFYLISGVGAAVVQQVVWALMYQPQLNLVAMNAGIQAVAQASNGLVTIGASGAVFGILFAFAWLFPEVEMFLLFIPIPIRARVFVIIYALVELFAGLAPTAGDNVAHFAHLGGMLFAWLLILYWRKKGLYGFETHKMEDSRLSWLIKQWLRDKWQQLKDKFPRSNKHSAGGNKKFHYHRNISED